MRLRAPLLTLASLALVACAAARAQEQQQQQQDDQQVIEDFVTTRGMGFTAPPKPKPKPAPARNNPAKNRKPASGDTASGKGPAAKGGAAAKPNGAGAGSKSDGAGSAAGTQAGGAAGDGAKFVQAGSRPLALGYTVFLKQKDVSQNDVLSYADPSQAFRTGDRIAIAFESNADGYLYLFNSSGGAATPEMIFPSASIDEGANALPANTYATFPPEVNDGFRFTEPAGTERLFVVFTRKPLAGVPTGDALVKFCRGQDEGCAWPVAPALWSRILDGAKGRRVKEVKNANLAQSELTPDTMAMVQRGLRLDKSAPKPAFLRLNDTPDADTLVTEIVFTHK